MPKQAPLRLIKRWRRYERREERFVPPVTRGVYVLYRRKRERYEVVYIGVGGIGKAARSGILGRLRNHRNKRKDWTHYSFFEVHDNISREEILELESLLLAIFRHDSRIDLENKQKGSGKLYQLRGKAAWSDVLKKKADV